MSDQEALTLRAKVEELEKLNCDLRKSVQKAISWLRACRHSMDSEKPFPSVEKLTEYISGLEELEKEAKEFVHRKAGYLVAIEELEKQLHEQFKGVLSIRCTKHFAIPQINHNECTGGECGACIEETLRAEFSTTQQDLAYAKSKLEELEKRKGWCRVEELEKCLGWITTFINREFESTSNMMKSAHNLKEHLQALIEKEK